MMSSPQTVLKAISPIVYVSSSIVMSELAQVRVPIADGEIALPSFAVGMDMVTVSPGSSLPLLLPDASSMINHQPPRRCSSTPLT